MRMARLLIVLILLTCTTSAQNYTIELERVIPEVNTATRIEPVIDPTYGLTHFTFTFESRYSTNEDENRAFVYSISEDVIDTIQISDRIFATLTLSDSAGGISSIYIAGRDFYTTSTLTLHRFFEVLGQQTHITQTAPCPDCDPARWLPIASMANLIPRIANNQFIGIRVSTSYQYDYNLWAGEHSSDFGETRDLLFDYSPDISEVQSIYDATYRDTSNIIGSDDPEVCYFRNYSSWNDPYCFEQYCGLTLIDNSTFTILSSDQSEIASLTTDHGKYGKLWIDNFDNTTPYDEILYQGLAVPLDGNGDKSNHIALFRMVGSYPERVWLILTTVNVDYYSKSSKIITGITRNGIVSYLDPATGQIPIQIDLRRELVATRFFEYPTSRNLGLVGRVADTIFVYNFGTPTSVADEETTIPTSFTLAQNFPNPFNPSTTITFYLDQPGTVRIEVYNIAGQRVTTLTNQFMSTGQHEVVWEGTDDNGDRVASGTYLYRLRAGDISETRKMILLK